MRIINTIRSSACLDSDKGLHNETSCGHLLKILAWDGQGLVLYAKRLERGKFVWPQAKEGAVSLTPAQLSMLTEGIDWRMPVRTWQPEMVG
jgi:transposase